MSARVRVMESDWANLPDVLLQMVLERLEILPSFLRFALVCTSWLRVAKNNRSLVKKLPRPPPLLLIDSGREHAWNVYDIMNNKVLDVQINVETNGVICGSSNGWLVILERDFSVTLVNAFSRILGREEKQNSTIRLPPLPSFKDLIGSVESFECETLVNKVFISADPIEEAEDCVVVITYQRISRVSFIRLGKDTTWTTSICFAIEQVVYSGDMFYGVGHSSRVLSFDSTTFTRSMSSCVKELGEPRGMHIKRYIVVLDENKLIMVQRHMIKEGAVYVTEKFKVYELNFDWSEWDEKTSLGDAALFVGNMSTVSVLASSFPGCQQDCIYFNYDNNYLADYDVRFFTISSSYDDYGVYNMKTGSISKPFSKEAMALEEKIKRPPVWVVPAFQL